MTQFDINQVYQELQALIADPKSGFRQRSYPLDNGNQAVVIDYTLSSYQYFKKPSGMRGRGIMFEINPQGQVVQLLARPMLKFFTYEECPDTMKLNMDISAIEEITDKADGSLMSTWVYNNELKVKSKGSIVSAEVKATMALLNSTLQAPRQQASPAMLKVCNATLDNAISNITYADLAKVLLEVTQQGYTVDLEYLSEKNPIVLQYAYDELRVLSINELLSDTEYTLEAALEAQILNAEQYHVLKAFQVFPYYNEKTSSTQLKEQLQEKGFKAFLLEIENIKGIEGVIIKLKQGQTAQKVKFKTQKYLTHTQALDSLSFDSRFPTQVYSLRDPFAVFAAIAEGYADDLIHAVRDCEPLANTVRNMQETLIPAYNALKHQLDSFVEDHKHMEKRDFVAESKKQLPPAIAAAAMTKLVHGHVDLLSTLRKNKGLLPDLTPYAISKREYPEHLKRVD